MQIYRVETTVLNDRTLMLKDLPFHANDKVEIIVHDYKCNQKAIKYYPLRGKAIYYIDPFGSVAEDNWDVLK